MEEENLKITAEDIFSDDEAAIACEKAFGIKYMFPWQRLVVANIMDAFAASSSRDETETPSRQIVLLPTGAGKSLCFQVPALLLPGPTLVIYPLLALMSDQERRMAEGSLESVVFRGGQTAMERRENFRKIREDGCRIIIANPEVLQNDELLEELCASGISHIAIDEAHTVSEWGNSFRKSYLELGRVIKKINAPVVTAFTATASDEVLGNIAEILFDGKAHVVRGECDRRNIHYYVYRSASKKTAALFLAGTEERPMLIFCSTRSRAQDMAREINFAYGNSVAKFYHAGLERSEKSEVEKWFFDKKDAILCATCAFGMGVDKSDIRTVIHLDPPETAEAYVQEAGRAGRDGEVANAILLWNYEDSLKARNFEDGSRKSVMRDFALKSSCRRETLLRALGGEDAVCSGCDLCDSKKRSAEAKKRFPRLGSSGHGFFIPRIYRKPVFLMPGESLPSPGDVLLSMIKARNRFHTDGTLEDAFLYAMNRDSMYRLGIKIWTHSAFVDSKKQLFHEGKIRVHKFLWKGRYSAAPNEEGAPKKISRIKLHVRRFRRPFRLFLRNFLPRFRHRSVQCSAVRVAESSFSSFWGVSCSSRQKYRSQRKGTRQPRSK